MGDIYHGHDGDLLLPQRRGQTAHPHTTKERLDRWEDHEKPA
nr:MAG TPA: hypothetical protein [Caudoviricetes sp.]